MLSLNDFNEITDETFIIFLQKYFGMEFFEEYFILNYNI
jgi:hypothetical protein